MHPAPRIFRRNLILAATIVFACACGFEGLKAWNGRVTPEKVAAGKILFEHEWNIGDSLCGGGDGLGPVFNARSCAACHFQGGLGGSSGNQFNVTSFEVISDGEKIKSGVVHADSISPRQQEKTSQVNALFPQTIQRSLVQSTVNMSDYCAPGQNQTTTREVMKVDDPVIFQELNSPALFGVGLIDKISNLSISLHGQKRFANIISKELTGDFSGNRLGIVNKANGNIGKFGWKGQFASLEEFVASACAMEIGLTNHLHAQQSPRAYEADTNAAMDMTPEQLHELVCFVRSIPRPVQILPEDTVGRFRAERGQLIFGQIGCADCHIEDLGGVEQIFSDFHLYNLEPIQPGGSRNGGYNDGEAEKQFEFDRSHPHPDQWQTPPLWGVADSAPYFHDGQSPTLRAAILRHQGQARSSSEYFSEMSAYDQACLLAFLKTLRGPQLTAQSLSQP